MRKERQHNTGATPHNWRARAEPRGEWTASRLRIIHDRFRMERNEANQATFGKFVAGFISSAHSPYSVAVLPEHDPFADALRLMEDVRADALAKGNDFRYCVATPPRDKLKYTDAQSHIIVDSQSYAVMSAYVQNKIGQLMQGGAGAARN